MKEEEMDQNHKRKSQNAREALSVANEASEILKGMGSVGTREGLAATAAMLETWAPECFPENEQGQVHFARAMMESSAAEIRAYLAVPQDATDQAEVPMCELPPLDPRVQQLMDQTLLVGSASALAQSLKVMGEQLAYDGHEGWAVIARRAERFVRVMHMQVTRFVQQPDCRLRHPTVDTDLLVAHVDVGDTGKVWVGCTDLEGQGWHSFPLDELVAAGPVNDVLRGMVTEMGKGIVHTAIGQLIDKGELPGFDTFDAAAEEARVNEALAIGGIHHLQVHPEYVLGEDGHADPAG